MLIFLNSFPFQEIQMKNIPAIGIQIPQILLPHSGIDLTKWAVIACDQFTSQPEYWRQVEDFVGDAPSTFNMVLPEVYLAQLGVERRIAKIQHSMQTYLQQGVFAGQDHLIYVERTVDGKQRRGLMLALDLEQYDYNLGASSLIRATEGTIIDRLPPRIKIREGAALELPHILVLIDDPGGTVIEAAAAEKNKLTLLYDFDLMLGSGHLAGFAVDNPAAEAQILQGLQSLADPAAFQEKYSLAQPEPVLLFAMGDGNHSLATAKAIWEKIKHKVGPEHPARYALVEIENVHDAGLDFEPIHRVLFNQRGDLFDSLQSTFGDSLQIEPLASPLEMERRVNSAAGEIQTVGYVQAGGTGLLHFMRPSANLAVGTLQAFLDSYLDAGGAENMDYVHGGDITIELGNQPGNIGFYLPAMPKGELFKTVILDGALPRKTFSLGEANEKRFYMESRRIS
jgi:hypothetical protein